MSKPDWYKVTDSQGIARYYRPDAPEGELLGALSDALDHLNAALKLHAQAPSRPGDPHPFCSHCGYEDFGWPCPTVAALGGPYTVTALRGDAV